MDAEGRSLLPKGTNPGAADVGGVELGLDEGEVLDLRDDFELAGEFGDALRLAGLDDEVILGGQQSQRRRRLFRVVGAGGAGERKQSQHAGQ